MRFCPYRAIFHEHPTIPKAPLTLCHWAKSSLGLQPIHAPTFGSARFLPPTFGSAHSRHLHSVQPAIIRVICLHKGVHKGV